MTLATHQVVKIGGNSTASNLMADTSADLAETPDGADLTAEQESQLWNQAQPLFDKLKESNEESAMWIPDLRDASLLAGAVAAVVAVSPVQAADKYVFGVCQVSRVDSGAEIRPLIDGDMYLAHYHDGDPRYQGFSFDRDDTKVTLIKAPSHGIVALANVPNVRNGQYHYTPSDGYVGQDRFVIQVERNGVKVRIQYLIEGLDENEPSIGICNPETRKISFTTPTIDNARLQFLLDASEQIAISTIRLRSCNQAIRS